MELLLWNRQWKQNVYQQREVLTFIKCAKNGLSLCLHRGTRQIKSGRQKLLQQSFMDSDQIHCMSSLTEVNSWTYFLWAKLQCNVHSYMKCKLSIWVFHTTALEEPTYIIWVAHKNLSDGFSGQSLSILDDIFSWRETRKKYPL